MAIRIGQPGSLVKPGDPVPGKVGHYYEAGQYAPSVEHLTSIKLQEMAQAGLLPDTGLDIYDDKGQISESKIKALDIRKELAKYNIQDHHPNLPHFAFVGLASVFNNIDEDIFHYLPISHIDWVSDVNLAEHETGSLASQVDQYSEVVNTSDKNLITAYARDNLSFTMIMFQPFFVYLAVPIVPAIKNVSTGLNVSSVSVLKTLGYMAFDKIRLTDKTMHTNFLNTFGWKHQTSIPANETARYMAAGTEVGINRGSKWFRDTGKPAISTSSTVSPKETFSELFMYYYVHRLYLEVKSAEYVEFMHDFIDYIAHM